MFGAGPVGLLAAYSSLLRGAAKVFVVDKEDDRLALAERIGAEAVNIADGDPVDAIVEATRGKGVDRGIEAVGYQAHDPSGEEHPEMVLDNLVKVVRSTGGIGVVGVYMPSDPGADQELAKDGRYAFQYGTLFTKGQSMGTGQCPVARYNRILRDLIISGRARAVVHRLARGRPGRGSGRLREVRPAGRRVHQGSVAPGGLTARRARPHPA